MANANDLVKFRRKMVKRNSHNRVQKPHVNWSRETIVAVIGAASVALLSGIALYEVAPLLGSGQITGVDWSTFSCLLRNARCTIVGTVFVVVWLIIRTLQYFTTRWLLLIDLPAWLFLSIGFILSAREVLYSPHNDDILSDTPFKTGGELMALSASYFSGGQVGRWKIHSERTELEARLRRAESNSNDDTNRAP